jgi:hypothetical protein
MSPTDADLERRAVLAADDDPDLDAVLDEEDGVDLLLDTSRFDIEQDPETSRYGGGLMDALWRGEV